MNETAITTHIKATLVKWEGDPPEDADPVGHPQCIEVIEIEDGREPTVIYRRKD